MRPSIPLVIVSLAALSCLSCAGKTTFDNTPPDRGVTQPEAGLFPDVGQLGDLGSRDLPTFYACDTIDILFVIDNSNSMEEEQTSLVKNFPKFIQTIEAIQPPIKSYHVGVISTDIGAGPYDLSQYGCPVGGDAGKLMHAPKGQDCQTSYPKFLSGPSATIAKDFGCIAALGLDGCGFEQQMEAALKALTNQPENKGFLRKNAPLAIIFITDEDDCSAKDTTIFDLNDQKHGKIPTRCVRLTNSLYPVSRYVQGFKALKDNPDRLVVAAITGPPGQVKLDPNRQTGMIPSCTSQDFGEAYPGNRFAELIKAFGDQGVQESLCKADLAKSLEIVGKAVSRACLK